MLRRGYCKFIESAGEFVFSPGLAYKSPPRPGFLRAETQTGELLFISLIVFFDINYIDIQL